MNRNKEMDEIPVERFIIDALVLVFLLILLGILRFLIKPFYSGFYCDDFSVNLLFKPSTISNTVLTSSAIFLPLLIIILSEVARTIYMKKKRNSLTMHNIYQIRLLNGRVSKWPEQFGNIVMNYGTYMFGLLCTLNLTLLGKQTIGRVRPNFLDVCKPLVDVYALDICKKTNYLIPLEDFQCANKDLSEVNESRKSFPSGHSSTSFYIAIFLILYLHRTWHKRHLGLLTHFFQFILFAMAFFTAMSRVVDNKHHPSDVIAGTVLGSVVAVFAYFHLSLFYRRYNYKNKYNIENNNNNRANEIRLVDIESQCSNTALLSNQKNCPKIV
jgi:phosphatidate phosphatase